MVFGVRDVNENHLRRFINLRLNINMINGLFVDELNAVFDFHGEFTG